MSVPLINPTAMDLYYNYLMTIIIFIKNAIITVLLNEQLNLRYINIRIAKHRFKNFQNYTYLSIQQALH